MVNNTFKNNRQSVPAPNSEQQPDAENLSLQAHHLTADKPDSTFGPDVTASPLKPVQNFIEFLATLSHAHDQYVMSGLMDPHPSGLRLTAHHLHPASRVFAMEKDDKVQSTFTFVPHTEEFGLPCQKQFGEELSAALPASARRAELTMLASARTSPKMNAQSWTETMRVALHVAEQDTDYLIIVAHPRHAKAYSKWMEFQPISKVKEYELANNNVGVALALDVRAVGRKEPFERSPLHEKILKHPLPQDHLATRFELKPNEVESLLYHCPEVLNTMTPSQVAFLDTIYDNAASNAQNRLSKLL